MSWTDCSCNEYNFGFFVWLQKFTNEDHLSVHKHKHEMTLIFGPARTDSVIIAGNISAMNICVWSMNAGEGSVITFLCFCVFLFCFLFLDQTPTPTRFLKNCEEVGLFNELANSFEQEFHKAHEDDQRSKHQVW